MKKALITGISGQDGHYLSKLLLEKGYEVHGICRRNSQASRGAIEYLPGNEKITIHWGDITDDIFIVETIKQEFDEIYHLAAQSFVSLSFENPKHTYDVNIGGTLNIVNAVKEYSPQTKLYFAATSELFGKVQETPQTEKTPFYPRSPYGISKLAAFWTIKNYRESYGLFACSGILFNHESQMRGPEFVTRKITQAVARIKKGKQEILEIGNLDARRDWGHSEDYVRGMWLMMQQENANDYVLATGKTHSVREFVEAAFKAVEIPIIWSGTEETEIGKDSTGKILVKVDKKFYRPAEVDTLTGDYTKAKTELGWEPNVSFAELVKKMVEHDLQ